MAKFGNVKDDFLGFSVETGTTRIHSTQSWTYGGTSATAPNVASSGSDSAGAVLLTADSGTTRFMALGNSITTGAVQVFDQVRLVRVRVRLSSVASIVVRFGLCTAANDSNFGSNAIYMLYDSSVDAFWHTVERASSTSTNTATAITAVSGSYETWEFVRISATLWHVFRTTSSGRSFVRALTSANLPGGATLCTTGAFISSSSGSKDLRLDLVELDSVEYSNR